MSKIWVGRFLPVTHKWEQQSVRSLKKKTDNR